MHLMRDLALAALLALPTVHCMNPTFVYGPQQLTTLAPATTLKTSILLPRPPPRPLNPRPTYNPTSEPSSTTRTAVYYEIPVATLTGSAASTVSPTMYFYQLNSCTRYESSTATTASEGITTGTTTSEAITSGIITSQPFTWAGQISQPTSNPDPAACQGFKFSPPPPPPGLDSWGSVYMPTMFDGYVDPNGYAGHGMQCFIQRPGDPDPAASCGDINVLQQLNVTGWMMPAGIINNHREAYGVPTQQPGTLDDDFTGHWAESCFAPTDEYPINQDMSIVCFQLTGS